MAVVATPDALFVIEGIRLPQKGILEVASCRIRNSAKVIDGNAVSTTITIGNALTGRFVGTLAPPKNLRTLTDRNSWSGQIDLSSMTEMDFNLGVMLSDDATTSAVILLTGYVADEVKRL